MKFLMAAALIGSAMTASESFKQVTDTPTNYFDFPVTLIGLNGVEDTTHYDRVGDMLKGKKATLVVNVASY